MEDLQWVYILSCNGEMHYTGCTSDLEKRLARHKRGSVPAIKNRRPVKLVTHLVFSDKYKAIDYEKYLKPGSGRGFFKKRLV